MNRHVCVCVCMLALFQVVFHSLLKHVVEGMSAERFTGLFKILWTPLKLLTVKNDVSIIHVVPYDKEETT